MTALCVMSRFVSKCVAHACPRSTSSSTATTADDSPSRSWIPTISPCQSPKRHPRRQTRRRSRSSSGRLSRRQLRRRPRTPRRKLPLRRCSPPRRLTSRGEEPTTHNVQIPISGMHPAHRVLHRFVQYCPSRCRRGRTASGRQAASSEPLL